jgi:tetratricopeptide (TPR) repeat protein
MLTANLCQAQGLKGKDRLDSIKVARAERTDSIKQARTAKKDSLILAKYGIVRPVDKKGKPYSDEKFQKFIEKKKQQKTDSIAYVRALKAEKAKKERKKKSEELVQERKERTEVNQKIRQERKDSLTKAREETLAKSKEARKKISDSVAKIRKTKSDSLLAKKNDRLKKLKNALKTPEQKQAELAMKKHKENQAKFSNQNFLKKPWVFPRSEYQNTVTRYNYYYNANKIFRENVLLNKKNNTQDYNQLLTVGTLKADNVGLMDTVIRKTAMSIQIHDPRGRWFDDLYLLQGKAYFVKGNYEDALATFQYVVNEYNKQPKKGPDSKKTSNTKRKKSLETEDKDSIINLATIERTKGLRKVLHHPVRNDALLWMAKSYMALDADGDAQNLLGMLEQDPNFPKRLKSELYLLSAQVYLKTNSIPQAIQSLEDAIANKKLKKADKVKTTFLLAQLYQQTEQYAKSTEQFKKVLRYKPDLDMDFYTKLNIAKNTSLDNNADADEIEKLFKQIISDGKYEPYREKALFVLGELQTKSNTDKAIKTLTNALAKTSVDKDVQLKAYILLGNLYFNKAMYRPSKLYYDSAIAAIASETDPRMIAINAKSSTLTDLVKELDIIAEQDSLIALSKLSPKEQEKAAKKILKQLKDKEEQLANGNEPTTNTEDNIENSKGATAATNTTWYFGNKNLLENGKAKFTQKFGNRPNADNWRRQAAIDVNNNKKEDDGTANENITKEDNSKEDDKDKELEKLLAKIPNTSEQLTFCETVRENALYNAAVIFYAGLNDGDKTIQYLELLLKDYTNTSYKVQSYYTLHKSYKAKNDAINADKYLKLLQDADPNSKLAKSALDTNYVDEVSSSQAQALAYYNDTYNEFAANKFNEVLPRIAFAKENFKEHPLFPKFELVEALSYTGLKKYDIARTQLTNVIKKYAGFEEATFAQDVLALLNEIDSANVDTTQVINNIKPSFSKEGTNTTYTFEPLQPHYFLFVLKVIDDRINPLKGGISDFNNIKHGADNLDNFMYLVNQNSGLIIYKQFINMKAAKDYMKELQDNKQIYSHYKSAEYELAIISENNYKLFKSTRDLEGYLKFYKQKYK